MDCLSILVSEALRLKTMPLTTVVAIGVGDWTQIYELQTIASHPYEQHLMSVKNYRSLDTIMGVITDIVCNGRSALYHETEQWSG